MKSLLLATLLIASAPDTETNQRSLPLPTELADRFEQLAQLFNKFQLTTYVYTIKNGLEQPDGQSNWAVDLGETWNRVVHFRPKYRTSELAERYDGLINWVSVRGDTRYEFWEKIGDAAISDLPPYPKYFVPTAYMEKLFIRSSDPRPIRDKPVIFLGNDKKEYRFRWCDIFLADAFRQPGWELHHEAPLAGQRTGLLHLSRQITTGLTDSVWLTPTKGYALICRKFMCGGKETLCFEYDDIYPIDDELWIPRVCRWKGSDSAAVEKLVSLHLGGESPVPPLPPFPPGTKVADLRSDKTYYIAGGEESLDGLIMRARYEFDLPKTNVDIWRLVTWRWIVVGTLLCAIAAILRASG